MAKLAVNGGKPVRTRPLAPSFPGASLYGEEEKRAVLEVIDRRSPFRYYGPALTHAVDSFERAFAKRIATNYALAVSSGTAALIIALKALDVGPGDEVLVPANTFIASAGAVLICGARPVYVDIDDTFNIDPTDLRNKVTSNTVALMPVHFEGAPCDMHSIIHFAQEHNLKVIEDVAQSCGASFKGRPLGSFGHISAFSFQINKMITAGEGGAVVTNQANLYQRAVRLHDQGNLREADGKLRIDRSGEALLGQNYRMNEISGALLGVQLQKLDGLIQSMRQIAKEIMLRIEGLPLMKMRRQLDPEGEIGRRIFMTFPNEQLALSAENAICAEGVPVERLYGGKAVFEHPQLRAPGSAQSCPRAVDLLARTLTLPVSPIWDTNDIDDISAAISKVVEFYAQRG